MKTVTISIKVTTDEELQVNSLSVNWGGVPVFEALGILEAAKQSLINNKHSDGAQRVLKKHFSDAAMNNLLSELHEDEKIKP